MQAKTIFLNDLDETIIYNSSWHTDNHDNYIKKYYPNLKITEYIPILLTKHNHCVIELSKSHQLGTIYLPSVMSFYQKKYFMTNINILAEYTLYLYGYSLELPIQTDELLHRIKIITNKKENS